MLPSTSEGLPLSILEAQASKVPVLAAPTAGIPEVVRDGETGFLIPADHAEVYANRIEILHANSGLYHHVTEQAYEQVTQEYSWRTYCYRIWELYKELLAEHTK
jgi:glycosyltransferase involved in cell wall biosynthesis